MTGTADQVTGASHLEPDYAIRIELEAERKVATSSPDHFIPWGTRRDNSRNSRFNSKLYALMPCNSAGASLYILDLGCSGGGFVRECINDGCIAVGLEGSDYSRKRRRAEWPVIPDNLFTCDITGEFHLFEVHQSSARELMQFDVVTSWEVMEHIAETDLAQVAANVRRHLKPQGLWIMSVSSKKEVFEGVALHQTVRDKPWWVAQFRDLGFEHLEAYVTYFNTQFVRGPKTDGPLTFHLVLSHSPSSAPPIPKETYRRRLYDLWLGSRLQRFLHLMIAAD